MSTVTRTVVFTDLANYTASVGRSDRAALRRLIAEHEKAVAPVVERHNGRIVKNLGDSFMAIFGAATDAVRASVELVENINAEGPFTMRVGLATGDVEEIDGDAFGEAVNLASRINGKAPAGQIWFSAATLMCMNQSELAWEPVGRFSLKGIVGEAEVFRAIPSHRCYLPDPIVQALRTNRLVRIARGDALPALPPDPVIVFEGFAPGSDALQEVVDSLPVVDPAALWLCAYKIPPVDRDRWLRAGHGIVVGQQLSLDRALSETRRPSTHTTSADTIILDVSGTSVLELVMAGLALPAVPMSEVVAGYSYDLLADGRWVNRSDQAVGRIDASPDGVRFTSLVPGIMVDGAQLMPGDSRFLHGDEALQAPSGTIHFRKVGGRAYLGLMVAETLSRLGIGPGQLAEVGREPNHPGLALPDRRGQDNIRWCVGSRAARARESGFTLDRALAGRRQAALQLGPSGATVISLHDRCPTFVVEGDNLEQVIGPRSTGPGDLIVTGTSVIAVKEPQA
ncbi:MAG: adenylate/guanylate cyclase domain-containing protein [Alphaproteobacteria bacterium]|nr:adenylate/guanylate cyclase domain-containing protein [Alphaproteobacteria bacterium]